MKYFILLTLFFASSGLCGPNSITDSNCLTFSKKFVKRGNWNDTAPGARLWDLDGIYRAMKSEADSPKDKENQSCVDLTWVQAKTDATEYWERRGEKENCIIEGTLIKTATVSCSEKERKWIGDNLGYLDSLAKSKVITAMVCNCGQNNKLKALSNQVIDITSRVPKDPPPPLKDDFKLTADVIQQINATQNVCSLISDKSLLKDPKKSSLPNSFTMDWSCLKGAAKGIWGSLKSNITGLWDLVKGAFGVVTGGKEYYALKSAFMGTIGPLMVEYTFNPLAAEVKLAQMLAPLAETLVARAQSSMADFACYKPEVQAELVCKSIGFVGTEVALTFLGGEALIAKLGKIGKVAEITAKLDGALVKAREAMNLKKVAVMAEGVEALANLRRVAGEAAKGLPWLDDVRNAVQVAIKNGKVFVRKSGEMFEVTNEALKKQIAGQVAAFNEKSEALIEAFKAKLAQNADSISVKIDRTVAEKASLDAQQAAEAAQRAALQDFGHIQNIPPPIQRVPTYIPRAKSIEEVAPLYKAAETGDTPYFKDRIFNEWLPHVVPRQGFKLHVSATADNAVAVAELVLPELRKMGVAHKVVEDIESYENFMTGGQQGKFITIYPRNNEEAAAVAKKIDEILMKNRLAGPSNFKNVAGEKMLGQSGGVFVRYGGMTPDSINGIIRVNERGFAVGRDGEIILHDGAPIDVNHSDSLIGNEIKQLLRNRGAIGDDVRGNFKPDWVEDPFQ